MKLPALTPVVVQDDATNNVLMLAYTSPESLRLTKKTGWMHYYSRSRQSLWKKGATSGHVQRVVGLFWDCDRDALLARVRQAGVACHRNQYSCFSKKIFRSRGVLDELWDVLAERARKHPRGSYTTKLLKDPNLRLKKLLEEAGELALAAHGRSRKEVVWEAADLAYHALVVLLAAGVSPGDVEGELRRRMVAGGSRPVRPRRRP